MKALLACVDDMVRDWDFKQIIFAHGTNPYTEDAAAAFRYPFLNCSLWCPKSIPLHN